MASKQLKIKRARQNIKLLEEADHDAINKVGEPRFKKILTEQEKQLHHYLAQYLDPNYLPAGITKEYEFPKYFYYTVNSKNHGVIQKRTRTDSAMFKRFMKNKTKLAEAKAQGIFKITDEPIKMEIKLPSQQPKTKGKKKNNQIIGNVDMGDIEDSPTIIDTGNIKNYMSEDINDFEYSKILNNFFDDLVKEKKAKVNRIKNMKFENLIEGIPSQSPKKKDIIITKKKKAKQNDNIELDMTNNYTILGLSEDADEGEIKSAYKKLVRKLHPDKTGGDKELTKKFIIVDTAYKKLMSGEEDIAHELSEQDEEDLQHREFLIELIKDTERKMVMGLSEINKLQKAISIEKSISDKKRLQNEMAELLERLNAFDNILKDCRDELSKAENKRPTDTKPPQPQPAQKYNTIENMTIKDIPKYWGRPNDAILLLKHFYPDAYKNLNKKANELYTKRKGINLPQMYTFLPKELNGAIFEYLQETAWDEYIDILFEMTEDMENIITELVGTILYERPDLYEEKHNNPSYFIQLTKYIPKKLLKKDKLYDLTHYKYKEDDGGKLRKTKKIKSHRKFIY